MPQLTDLDEQFVHQLPEPLPVTAVPHQHWREAYFFGVHERSTDAAGAAGDGICVAMGTYPARQTMAGIVLSRIAGTPFHPGGLSLMSVRTDDGREGVAIYEVTGNHHHRYFPSPLGERVTAAAVSGA